MKKWLKVKKNKINLCFWGGYSSGAMAVMPHWYLVICAIPICVFCLLILNGELE